MKVNYRANCFVRSHLALDLVRVLAEVAGFATYTLGCALTKEFQKVGTTAAAVSHTVLDHCSKSLELVFSVLGRFLLLTRGLVDQESKGTRVLLRVVKNGL